MKKSINQMSKYELGELPANDLVKIADALRARNAGFEAKLNERRNQLSQKASVKRDIAGELVAAPFFMGNEGDLNKIVWPFMMASEVVEIPGGGTLTANISITQEAAFVVTHISAALYKRTDIATSVASGAIFTIGFFTNVRTGDIITLLGNDYVFGTDFVIGATLNDTIDNLVAFINGTALLSNDLVAARPSSGIMTLTTVATGANIQNNYEVLFERGAGDANLPRVTSITNGSDAISASTTIELVDLDAGNEVPEIDLLRYNIVDSQSKRSFHDQPINFSHLGGSRRPLILDAPYLILQNQNWEVRYTNDGSTTYIPQLCLHGYRIRIDEAREMLSLATA